MKKIEINISEATTKELVEFHNAELVNLPADSKIRKQPVKKFTDRKTAEKRVAALVEEINAAIESDEVEPVAGRAVNNSAGIAKSWEDPKVAAKRAQRSGVEVDGEYYGSVHKAYIALGLDLKDHIQFRMLLKENGKAKVEGRKWKIVPINYDK